LTRSLRAASARDALVSVDQEGGLVRRIPFARPREGQREQGSVARVRRAAQQAARDLRRLGINVNFAPVADVPSDWRADIFPRAFAGGAATIAKKVVTAIGGYRGGRLAATVKHFPGLGAARSNTDATTVVIRRSARALRASDLVPFRAAVAADVPLIMVSHARYTAIDRARVASQSPRVLRDLLREQLHYRGVVVTDALEARAVLRHQSVAIAAERSLRAGCDLLLATHPSSYRTVFRRLLQTARTSGAMRLRVRESAARVLALKRSLGLRLPRPRH
jgi:beta-N-acetylhexosaminidase